MFGSNIKIKIDTAGGAEIEVRSVAELRQAMDSLIEFNHAKAEDMIKQQQAAMRKADPEMEQK